jgi:hypothetical protein
MRGLTNYGRAAIILCALLMGFSLAAQRAIAAHAAPKPQHIFIIVLENEGFDITFGAKSPAVYLKALAKQGALLKNYYGTGHNSLDNYISMISGQAPNPITQADCQSFIDFLSTGTAKYDQEIGAGCVYPANVTTLANQLQAKGLSWKGYMEDMGNMPARESATCGHPPIGAKDNTQKAVVGDQYASRHDPFVYFHSIIDDAANCDAHVVNLSKLAADLQDEKTTPNFSFITPNLCNDGHDGGGDKKCVDGQPGGLVSADKFLADLVPKILAAPAFKHDGLLIVTFDEADIDIDFDQKTGKMTVKGDPSACCNEKNGPNIQQGSMIVWSPTDKNPDHGPGIAGPGGGRIGAVLVSRFIEPGTLSKTPYNHYSMLRSIEDFFGLGHLGYAAQKGLKTFGKDVFTRPGG